MKRNKLGTLVATIAGAVALATAPVPAYADSPELPAEFVAELTSVWTEHGVSEETQAALLDKLESGAMVDANLGVEPLAVASTESDGWLQQVSTYPDGSISVSKFELGEEVEEGDVRARGIVGCTQSNYTFTNCSVQGWFTAVTLAFLADYTLNGIHTSRITNAEAGTVQCMVIACSDPVFEWVRHQQSGSNPAHVNLAATWNQFPIGSGTTRLSLQVRDYSAWTN